MFGCCLTNIPLEEVAVIAFSHPAPAEPGSAERPSVPSTPGRPLDGASRQKRAERLGDDIARLGAHLDAALYRQLVMIREFDEIEGWHIQGSKSCAQWLSWRTGLAPGAARERVRVARSLEPLPRLSDALRTGRLSYSAARALTRVATPDNEAELVEVARHTTAAQLERLVHGWRAIDRASEAEGERARHEQRGMSLVPDPDGSWVQRGRLDPEVGAEEDRLLDLAERILAAQGVLDRDATPRQRRADAFALLLEAAHDGLERMAAEVAEEADAARGAELSGSGTTARAPVSSRADRLHVVVHVSEETLRTPEERCRATGGSGTPATGEGGAGLAAGLRNAFPDHAESRIERGPRVSAETARRLACDAGIVRMRHDRQGRVLDVGRRMRSVPPAIRRALDRRDGGCRFPGCTSRICDAHQLRHWADGGETKLDNLVLLCRWHHRRVHEDGWRIERAGDGGVRFRRPDGRGLPEVPPRPEFAADAVQALEREQRGLGIDPWTATTRWLGDPFDVDWALFTLRPASGIECRSSHAHGRASAETSARVMTM